MTGRVVIIGAGQGGLQVAESLRSAKYAGEIVLCGEEDFLPYHRPPLSKGLLLGEMSVDQLTIRQPAVFEKKQITVHTKTTVTAVTPAQKTVTLADGSTLDYDHLVFATGATPRPLPLSGADADGVHSLRTLDDTLAVQASLATANNVIVVGGGFIGLEMAAVARKMGKQVTIVEFADRLMARVVSPEVSAFYQQLHQQQGCKLLLNTGVTGLTIHSTGAVTGVEVNDSEVLPADVVVLGIGVVANMALAQSAGIECAQGIVTDRSGRTSMPDIYAIGDCAVQKLEDGSMLRLESVQNAVEMAKACAAAITGEDKPFVAAPWFWSDQYHIKLQMVGLSSGYDQIVLRGDKTTETFSYFYFKAGRLLAIDSINRAADHMVGRRLLQAANSLTPEQAADTLFDLKTAIL